MPFLPALKERLRARRRRLARLSYGLSGSIFLIGAWDGYTSNPQASPLLIWTGVVSGMLQLGALEWSRAGEPPERLANGLSAVGLFVSAIASMHHKTGIQYAYGFSGLIYTALAVFGIERIAYFIKRRPFEAVLAEGEKESLPQE